MRALLNIIWHINQAKLEELYQQWQERLESQEQEMARKSMAAAAVSVVTSLCDNPQQAFSSISPFRTGSMRVPLETATIGSNYLSSKAKSDIAKTATWLDEAEALLSKKINGNQREIQEEMKVIESLINQGPAILSISAELPKILGSNRMIPTMQKLHSCPDLRILSSTDGVYPEQEVTTPPTGKRKRSQSGEDFITNSPNNPMKILASLSSQAAPVPIKHSVVAGRTVQEDAKTFVNFLQSVNK